MFFILAHQLNHLGNVLATVSDKTNGTTADVLTMNDYYPFGMLQEGRNYTQNSTYRYGFNGKENDNDIGQGVGKQQDYGMRIYNPRLGRFFSVLAYVRCNHRTIKTRVILYKMGLKIKA